MRRCGALLWAVRPGLACDSVIDVMRAANIQLPRAAIRQFCEKWQIREFALFGSVLRDDFRPDSDVDVLVTFAESSTHSLLDYPEMEAELSQLLGRRAEIVNRRAIERSHNWIRRRRILESARVVYAA